MSETEACGVRCKYAVDRQDDIEKGGEQSEESGIQVSAACPVSQQMEEHECFGHVRKKGLYIQISLSMEVKPFSGQSKMVETKAVEDIPEVSKILLDKLIDKCEKNGIKIMFMETPTAKSWNYARHNAMVKYAKAKNIDFVDMNTLKGDYAIDWSTDTRDGGRHLNCKGAEKVSAYLGKYISENYSFKDKRHSEKYADWNNDYLDYVKYMSGETVSLEAQQSEGTVSNN